jgi:hypothetical protein
MLTHSQYKHLWTAPAPIGFGQPLATIPDYNYYLVRENMFEDYLDIFRGVDTRHARLAMHPVVMPYEHPYTNIINDIKEGKIKKPCIKYILIAEAAPPFISRSLDKSGNDNGNSFFYSIIDTKATGYFTATANAFDINTALAKVQILLHLAVQGCLLIDIFPFAIDYNRLRTFLITRGVLTEFLFGALGNPYALINRITSIDEFFCNSHIPKASFVAPPKISHHIAENMALGMYPLFTRLSINLSLNQFGPFGGPLLPGIPAVNPTHTLYFFDWPLGTNLNGVYLRTISMAPKYHCCAYGPSMLVPHTTLIKNALDL